MRKLIFLSALILAAIAVGSALGGSSWIITAGDQIKNGVIPADKLTPAARQALAGNDGARGPQGERGPRGFTGEQGAKGDTGTAGAQGAVGPQGPKGDTGATGATGPQGATGATGPQGPAGTNAPVPTYGIAQVLVSRGGGTANPWATYSTSLGSPVGDTASGAFRFTCSNAPCKVSVQAYTTDRGTVTMYPRVLIERQDYNAGGPNVYCEYGDGTDNNGGTASLGSSAQLVTLGIGGTLDCGSGQSYPSNGVASEIDVPSGYYNVYSTFTFKK